MAPTDRNEPSHPVARVGEVHLALPLERLVALLPEDRDHDQRWNARRHGERIPFCKPVGIRRISVGERTWPPGRRSMPPPTDGSISAVEVEARFDGWTLNVCHGGMRIITETPLAEGDVIQVEVNTAERSYVGAATVQWVRAEADGVVAGLKFTRG